MNAWSLLLRTAGLAELAGLVAAGASAVGAPQADAETRARWNRHTDPFRVIGNVYFVGTEGLGAFLITTPDGAILIDGGLPESVSEIAEHIDAVGGRLDDVRLLLNSHAHFDHAGGLAELKRRTGARLVASEADAPTLERGAGADMPPVAVDRRVRDGDTVTLGGVTLTAVVMPGHTKGCTSWTTTVADGGREYTVFFHCSTSVVDRLVGNAAYPDIVADYERTFARLETQPADVFLANHPQFFDLAGKRERMVPGGPNPFVDADELRQYNARSRDAFRAALARERGGGAPGADVAPAGPPSGLDRQAPAAIDAEPPSARVTGAPGTLAIRARECRSFPASDIRRRIIDLAVQEWAYFGFAVVDQTADESDEPQGFGRGSRGRRRGGGESVRTAASIAGYWAVTPDGPWIVDSQNAMWNERDDDSARWRYAWSAAFVSWVMCESGLASAGSFARAVAHHTYVDQAIRARDGRASAAAFQAFDAGEQDIATGDLVCTARRPEYRSLAERRRQMGVGARTHCDIVVKVDEARGRLFAIGGNVRGTVGLKAMTVARPGGGALRVVVPERGRPIFAHLKLRASFAAADTFDRTPAARALGCGTPAMTSWRTAAALVAHPGLDCAE